MSTPAIVVDGIGKKYKIGLRENADRTFREAIMDTVTYPIRRFRTLGEHTTAADEFWALKDVSFEVPTGEVIGIIGRNGAGKSTLLKILSRITEPTEGTAMIRGRVGSLLEVGTGFNPELTGRENVYLNGAILGMKRAEIDRKFDEIVAFAEVDRFLDTPVKRYSSGMRVRLAFAVAAHLEPEILLIDEVLAVGDVAFQKKCIGQMSDFAAASRTVVFVSHNMGAITRLCNRAILLDEGRIVIDDEAETVVRQYLQSGAYVAGERSWPEGLANTGIDEFRYLSVRVVGGDGQVTSTVDVRNGFDIELTYEIRRPLPFCRVGFFLSTMDGIDIFEAYDADDEQFGGRREPGIRVARCHVPGNLLNPGNVLLSLNAGIPGTRNLARLRGALTVTVEDTGATGSYMFRKRRGVIRPRLHWECVEDVPPMDGSATTGPPHADD